MRPKVIEAPEAEPITVAQARAHCEAPAYEDSDVDPIDDEQFERWIATAREWCESWTGLAFSTRTLEVALDCFPGNREWRYPSLFGRGILLPMGPVRHIYSISWGDESDDEMAETEFLLDDYQSPQVLRPVAVTGWPLVTYAPNAIKIRYLTGYGVDSEGGEALPKSLESAMLLIIGHLYANREESTDAVLMTIPLGVKSLLRPYRVRLGMA